MIRAVHNSFSRPEVFSMSRPDDDEKQDAFHFVGWVCRARRSVLMAMLQPGRAAATALGSEDHPHSS